MNTKPFYASKGVMGSLAVILTAVLSLIGYSVDEATQAQLTDLLLGAGALIGGIVALWGRLTASSRIVAKDKNQLGIANVGMLFVLAMLSVSLYGCPSLAPRPEAPKTVPEQIEAAALLVQTLSDKINEATCGTFENKVCTDPTTPLMPDTGIKLHSIVESADETLQATRLIPVNGTGDCVGQSRTQLACLQSVEALLAQVQAYLISQQKGAP